ncbi:hypothetical protein PBY51_014503 [Eleginops maclovinus]|uniref:Uncharacterized protein n=1 Tax=Eleginops maclovinus TaxID=56733 RepID=A0AAN7WWU1_ELEMC|nr:hypothetical protein PBY51_014503 [Eleginops maclovinus]
MKSVSAGSDRSYAGKRMRRGVQGNVPCDTEATGPGEAAVFGHSGVGGFLLVVHQRLSVHTRCTNRDLMECHCRDRRCIYVRTYLCLREKVEGV